jgi:hypothetical protein
MSFLVTADDVEKMASISSKKKGKDNDGNIKYPVIYLSKQNFFQAFSVDGDMLGDMFDLLVEMQKEIDLYNPCIVLGYESFKDLFHWHLFNNIQERGTMTALHYDIKGHHTSKFGKIVKREERKRVAPTKPKKKWKVYA